MYIIRNLLRCFSSEIFGVAECEIIHLVNCEISHFVRCEIKFAFSHLRSKYFTAELFHMAEPYFTRRRRISLKKAHIVLVDKCVLFSGWDSWTRTSEMQESKSCALPTWRYPIIKLYHEFRSLDRVTEENYIIIPS